MNTHSYTKDDGTHVVHYAKRDAQEHHMIPRQLRDHPMVRSSAYNIEGESNLIFLPTGRSGMGSNPEGHSIHLGSHPDYTAKIERQFDNSYARAELDNYTKQERLQQVQDTALQAQSWLTQRDEYGDAFRMNARQDRWDKAIQMSQKPTGEIKSTKTPPTHGAKKGDDSSRYLASASDAERSLFSSEQTRPQPTEYYFPKENVTTLATTDIKSEQDNLMNGRSGVETIVTSSTDENGGVTFSPEVYDTFKKQRQYQLVMKTTVKITSDELAQIIDELRSMVYVVGRKLDYNMMKGQDFHIIGQTSMEDTMIGRLFEQADMFLKGCVHFGVFFPDDKIDAGLELLKDTERIKGMVDKDSGKILLNNALYKEFLSHGAIDLTAHPEHKSMIEAFKLLFNQYEKKYNPTRGANGYLIEPKTESIKQNGELVVIKPKLSIKHHFSDGSCYDSDSLIEPNPFKFLTENMAKNSPKFQAILDKIKVIYSLYVLFCNLKANGQMPITPKPRHSKAVKTHRLMPHILCQLPDSPTFIDGGVSLKNKNSVLHSLSDEEKKRYEGQYGNLAKSLSIKIEVEETSRLNLADTKRRYEETKMALRQRKEILTFDSSRLSKDFQSTTIDPVRVKVSTGITSYGPKDKIQPNHLNMALKSTNKQAVLIGLLKQASATTINETMVTSSNYALILYLIFHQPFAVLDMVLEKQSIDVTKKYHDKTALFYLMNKWDKNRDQIAKLAEYGIDLNELDNRGKSIMEHAIEKNDKDLFCKVRNNTTFNRDMKIDGMSLLQYALKHDRITMSRELLKVKPDSIYHKDKDGHDALYYAYRYQSKDYMADKIIEKMETDEKNKMEDEMLKQNQQQEREKEEERLALKIEEMKLKNRVKKKVLKTFCMAQ